MAVKKQSAKKPEPKKAVKKAVKEAQPAKKAVKQPKSDPWKNQQAKELLQEAEARHWSWPALAVEMKKLGATYVETHVCCGATWVWWPNESNYKHMDKHFGPFDYDDIPWEADPKKVKALMDYIQKPGLDHAKMAKMMVEAGVYAVVVDLEKGVCELQNSPSERKMQVVGSFKVKLPEATTSHNNFDKLMETFFAAAKEEWPHGKIYDVINKLGVEGFGFDMPTKMTTFMWSDGTRDYVDETSYYKKKPPVAAKLNAKNVAKLSDDFQNHRIEYTDYMPALATAGVDYFYTCLVDKETTYWSKDGKVTFVEKFKLL